MKSSPGEKEQSANEQIEIFSFLRCRPLKKFNRNYAVISSIVIRSKVFIFDHRFTSSLHRVQPVFLVMEDVPDDHLLSTFDFLADLIQYS